MDKKIRTPLDDKAIRQLRAGDRVLLSGVIYTARDAAHARLFEMMEKGMELPIPLKGQVIYYAGPTPNRPKRPVGSLGPTTSGRMDIYTPQLLGAGLGGMIGKGRRNNAVIEAIKRHGAVYFGATGGAGALLSGCVRAREVVAFADLQSEAIAKLIVSDFPCVVVVDANGDDLYDLGPKAYLASLENK
jgi:fumarate hydratase subunit beta